MLRTSTNSELDLKIVSHIRSKVIVFSCHRYVTLIFDILIVYFFRYVVGTSLLHRIYHVSIPITAYLISYGAFRRLALESI